MKIKVNKVSSSKHIGKRDYQQDFLTAKTVNGIVYAAVFDGLGGHDYGEEAASIANSTFSDLCENHEMDYIADLADKAICEMADHKKASSYRTPSTTAVMCKVTPDEIEFYSIGDSFILLYAEGKDVPLILNVPDEYPSGGLAAALGASRFRGMEFLFLKDRSSFKPDIPVGKYTIVLATDGIEHVLASECFNTGEVAHDADKLMKLILDINYRNQDNIALVCINFEVT